MTDEKQKPLISVIIPTYNRADLLKLSLDSLIGQSIPHNQFEVIVIDDGSTDNSLELCAGYKSKLPIKYLRLQNNSGISAAKNLGIFTARSEIIFFFDDDDVADKNLLAEHLKSHRQYPTEKIAVLGYTTWEKSLQVNQVMNYITKKGQFLFSYESIKDGQELDFTYFWGGRSSCKRSLLVKHGIFNPKFRFGSEDIELGYRLSRFGLKVIYNEKAISYMVRQVTFDEFCRRCEKQGMSQYTFSQLHPDPVVQQYCQIIDARQKWEYVKKTLGEKIQRVHDIELFISSVSSKDKEAITRAESLLPELGNLYWWTFNACKNKGLIDAMDSHSVNAIHDPKILTEISGADTNHFNKKWSHVTDHFKKGRNILVIDPTLPWFDRASGSLRLFHILLSLRQLGNHITFIARDGAYAEQYVPQLQQMGIEVYAGDVSALAAAGNTVIGPLLDIKKILKEREYSDVILSFWDIAEYYLPLIRKYSPRSRVIVDTVDIHFVRELREAELNKDEAYRAKALERQNRELAMYNQADMLWLITEQDQQAIRQYIDNKPIEIIPNIHEKININKHFDETSDLLFIGNFNHRPNRDAVLFFCREIFPKIIHEIPDIKLYVVGNNPPDDIKSLSSGNIIIKGYVPNLSPYLQKARVSICPLRYGAGMKGKIGEALSWGIPVVTTSIGAEGMNMRSGIDALIADTALNFAGEVSRLYNNKELWQALSENGKKKVEENWSPEVIVNKLGRIFSCESDKFSKKLVSIIILTYNGLDFTKQCIESLQKYTQEPHEIIFIDNASSDGTIEYLKKQVQENKNYKLIINDTNRGFPAGNNQGMQIANSDYILLLNNDVVVTENWLSGLLECAESNPVIGMVGPKTNYISGPQREQIVKYKNLSALTRYAKDYRVKNRGRWDEFPRLTGFALLIKREVIDKIGGFDPMFGKGNFEDDDFSLRSRLAGYKSMIVGDVFLHHFGGKSFRNDGDKKYLEQLSMNEKIFELKWGISAERLWKENIVPKSRIAYVPLDTDGVEESFARASYYYNSQMYTTALEYLAVAESLLKAGLQFNNEISLYDISFSRGNCYLKMEMLQKAKDEFEYALKLKSDSPEACYNLGVCHVQA